MTGKVLTPEELKMAAEINSKVQRLDEIGLAKVMGFVPGLTVRAGYDEGRKEAAA